jgi:hypothetical protein
MKNLHELLVFPEPVIDANGSMQNLADSGAAGDGSSEARETL